jgi:hypothetical protein
MDAAFKMPMAWNFILLPPVACGTNPFGAKRNELVAALMGEKS